MNEQKKKQELLRDVLGESAFGSRRDALLAGTLRHVHARRRMRHVRRGACALGLVLVALVVLFLSPRRPPLVETRVSPPTPYLLVETQPLRPADLVVSKSLSPGSCVHTVPTPEIVTTAAARLQLEVVNDEALLAMAAPNPAVLVRHDGKAELVFVNSEKSAE
jgi:hypothetical protein